MALILILGFILGISLGSFIKVIADRSLINKSIKGRSYCENCQKTIRWYDLFPVVSFLVLRGKCRFCKKPIPSENFLTEVLTGLLVALLFYLKIPPNFLTIPVAAQIILILELLVSILIIGVLVSVFITDIKKGLIPDRITYPAFLIGLVLLLVIFIDKVVFLYFSLASNPIGKYLLPPHSNYFFEHILLVFSPVWIGLLSAFFIGLFFTITILITRGRGMGGGDLKLGVFLGLTFGFPNSLLVLMLAFLMGSVVGILLLLFGKKKFGQTIPFGPFLSVGGLIALFWGNQILNWYLNLSVG